MKGAKISQYLCLSSTPEAKHILIVWCLLWCLLALAVFLNAYFMFLPKNTISDEEQYITQVISLANGHPQGWGIRSFFFPGFLTPAVLLTDIFEPVSWSQQVFIVRFSNWVVAWLAVIFTAILARDLFGKKTAIISAILLLMLSPWIIESTRVMMDMPAAMWILLASIFVIRDLRIWSNIVFAVCFASAAVFTKFQAAPAAIGIGLAIIILSVNLQLIVRNFLVMLGTAVGMVVVFAFIDWLTLGQPFASILNFWDYNFASPKVFQEKYGVPDSLGFYVRNIHIVYSYIFPLLVCVGAVFALRSRPAIALLLPLLLYLFVIHSVGHKQLRYLLLVTPYMAILAGYSLALLWQMSNKLILRSGNINQGLAVLFVLIFSSIVLLVTYSTVPRNDLRSGSNVNEMCMDFVEDVVTKASVLQEGATVILAVPCAVPNYFLPTRFSFIEITSGFDSETTIIALEKARHRLASADYAVMATTGAIFDLMGKQNAYEVLKSSSHGEYALFKRHRIKER